MTSANQSLAGVRVLVVDDNEDEREMFAFVLERQGADVITVASAESALKALARARPDVLVSDICMTGTDGYTLIKEVRRRSDDEGGRIAAVAVTGWASAGDRTSAIDAGFQVHLAKPVALDTLVAIISGLARAAQQVSHA